MAGYIGTTPVPQATQHRESFTATGGQTSFATAGYTPQFIDVYLNGVKLAPADYTATNGSDVVLASGATASDILEIVAYTPFEIASQTFTGDTTANNFAVTGTFTSRGIDDNADAVAITIDSSENVGIGTSSPNGLLELSAGDGGGTLNIVSTVNAANAGNKIAFFAAGRSDTDEEMAYIKPLLVTNSGGSGNVQEGHLTFGTTGTERMRIDNDGNLLVGTTSTAISNVGAVVFPSGVMTITNDGGRPLRLNRKTSDGDILQFDKDGSAVGSIGVNSTGAELFIEGVSGKAGLRFGSTKITASLGGTTSGQDGVVDLGQSSTRFKDLYLSGGVYLGGTDAANKLDDYEEGTWEPTVTGSSTAGTTTYSSRNGYYTKIGRLVNINCIINWTSMTGAGFMELKGIPYAIANLSPGSQNYPVGAALPSNINWTGGTMLVGLGLGGSSIIALYGSSDDGGATRQNCVNESANFRLTMSYMTT